MSKSKIKELEVTQRKDVESIRREMELTREGDKKALDVALRGTKMALDLKSAEDSKHFEKLNHEAEQLKEMQAKYLPREVYNNDKAEQTRKFDELFAEKNKSTGKSVVYGTVIGFILTLAITLVVLYANGKL